MAPKQGDRKNRGNPEAQHASDAGSEAAQASPERREGRRRGGRRKEGGGSDQAAAPDRQRKRSKGRTGELQRAHGQPQPAAEPAHGLPQTVAHATPPPPEPAPEPAHGEPETVAHATPPPPELAPEPAHGEPETVAHATPPPPEPASDRTSDAEQSAPPERRTVPPSIPAPAPSARAPGFHIITEGPPKLNRTEPPTPTLRAGEAPAVRELPATLAAAVDELPSPFSAFATRWNRAGSETGRAFAIAAGIDASARLLCASWLGVISVTPHPRWRTEAGNLVVSRAWYRRELPSSAWVQMSLRLASIVAGEPEGVLGNVARAFADAGGLADDLSQALDSMGPNSANDRESLLIELFSSLLSLCRPMRGLRLLGFDRRVVVAGDGEALWKVREMKGLAPQEARDEWHTGPIAPGACFFELDDASRVPLAPVLSARQCLDCSSLEVHVADMLSFGASERAIRCLRCGRSSKDRSAHPHLRGLDNSVRLWAAL